MADRKDLQKLLRKPAASKGLGKKINKNWKQQISQSKTKQSATAWRIASVSAACVFIFIVTIGVTNQTPAMVDAAYIDIKKDELLDIGISIPSQTWLSSYQIQTPPAAMVVKMTKYCVIDGQKTTHLKISGESRGEVHLFIQSKRFNKEFWQKEKGVIKTMPWLIMTPRSDLSVLVLYTENMNPKNVKKMLRTMLYV